MFLYQENNTYFAQIASGLEEEAEKELGWFGAKNTQRQPRGIRFQADKAALYRINYKSRLITRVLAPLISFPCTNGDELYEAASAVKWRRFLNVRETFAVFSNVSDSTIDNSHFASLRLKDAIADCFTRFRGKRPDVDTKNPDVWFNIHIHKDEAVVSLDTSGGSLHKRGYRKRSVDAPMQETVAAAMIQLSDWDGESPIIDPMCGSGTLLSEAHMYACNIPAGYLKQKFGFEHLPDYDETIWTDVKKKSDKRIIKLDKGLISGNDINEKAAKAAMKNVNALPGGNRISISIGHFENVEVPEDAVIMCNPPYGIRLKSKEGMDVFYKKLGDFLKQKCKGCSAYIYFGEPKYLKNIGLKAEWKKNLRNGGLDGKLAKYEMY